MGTTPWVGLSYVQEDPNSPAVYISWEDMQAFFDSLAARGLTGFRLPTEAEWAYTCRAGTETLWSFGDDEGQLGQYAWYWDNTWAVGEEYAHEVGTKLPNPWGLYDMHGNVHEWVQDWLGAYASDAQTDPTGPSTGESRVLRDGAFPYGATGTRSAIRGIGSPFDGYYFSGARLLRQEPRLYGDVTDNGAVTSLDASWTLQDPVGLRTLTGEDSVAADVSGRMGITAYDASLILQYVVGMISVFPVEEGGIPDPVTKSLVSVRNVSVGQVASRSAGRSSVPILIDEMDGVIAGEMTLSLDGHIGDATVTTAHLTDGYLLAHNVEDGRILVSFAGAESRHGAGPVLELVFDESDGEILGSLRLERVSLNEGMIPVEIKGAQVEIPTAYRLNPNYPNPFNPATTLRYALPADAQVTVAIYNAMGQRIRTLVEGEQAAGHHRVVWDGRDDAGQAVASGLYLCRLVSGEFSAVRKLMLVR